MSLEELKIHKEHNSSSFEQKNMEKEVLMPWKNDNGFNPDGIAIEIWKNMEKTDILA